MGKDQQCTAQKEADAGSIQKTATPPETVTSAESKLICVIYYCNTQQSVASTTRFLNALRMPKERQAKKRDHFAAGQVWC